MLSLYLFPPQGLGVPWRLSEGGHAQRGLGDLQLPLKQGRRESGGCRQGGNAYHLYVSKYVLFLYTADR